MTTQYWITGASGDWSTGSDWLSGASPTSTDDAVINNSYAVTVNGTAVAHSLTLNNSTLTLSGALTLGTSLTVDGGGLNLSGGTLSAQSIVSDSGTYGYLYGYGTVIGAVSGSVDIGANGGTLTVQGSLAGDQGYFYINSGATLELSTGTSLAIDFYGNPATLKLDAPTAFTGSIQNITLGDTIDLVGIAASSASYSGSTLTINETNGQQLSYSVSGSVAGNILTVASDNNGGTDIYWSQSPKSWITGASGDWSTGSDWLSGASPTSTDDAVINNSYAVTVNGTAVAHSLTLNNSTLTLSGALTLGTSLTVDGGGLNLSGGTLSAQSIVSDSGTYGYLYGYGTVIGAVSGSVDIGANGGTLTVQGSLAGDQGYFYINSGATLELSTGTSLAIDFYGNPATLKLDAPTAFTGSIQNITLGDTIDLVGIAASSASYSGSTLTINETNGQQLSYSVSGSVAGNILTVASDNNGGTDIYWSEPQPSVPPVAASVYWITGASGDWSTGSDWLSGVPPTSTADAVINNSSAVTVNGTAVAHSLTLNNSTVIVSGALTLGTSLTVDGGAYLKLGGGTLSAQSIVSDSGTSGSLFGYGTVGGAVSGGVNIWADGGTLKVQGSLAGDQGAFFIDSGASLELSNGSANEILFNGNLRHAQTRRAHGIHRTDLHHHSRRYD